MEDLPEQERKKNVVDALEIQYYEVQLELYEVKFEILKYEEILLVTQLDSTKRLIKGKLFIYLFIYWPNPEYVEVPRPGVQPTPQQ